ncbi:MAG: Plasmid stabilization system [Candidatus Brocadiaceae bacterium]|nr:Plasmid stabilization system [Candidatus Brocadiaceae bacterium]
MKIDFRKSFSRDIKKIKIKNVLNQIKEAIAAVENTSNLVDLKNIKQLTSDGKYFRMRIGDYRLGLKLEKDVVVFVRFLHRKDIYRYFPS